MRREKKAVTGKSKNVAPSRKKLRFSGKEEREPRQVDQPLIDFCLGEVGVHGAHGPQAGCHVVGDLATDVGTAVARDRRRSPGRVRHVSGQVGLQLESLTGADVVQSHQQAGIGHPAQALVALVAGPQQLLLLAADRPLEVDAPRGRIRIERDRPEGNVDFDGPANLALPDAGVPDAVPLAVVGAARPHQRVGHQPGGVHLEEVAGLLVQERVHRPHEPVVGAQELVALSGVALQLVWFGVEADDADVEMVLAERDADFRALGGRGAKRRVLLDELACILRPLPDGLVENPVQHHPFFGLHAFGFENATAGGERIDRLRPGAGGGEQDQARDGKQTKHEASRIRHWPG